MQIRKYHARDIDEILELFYQTVHTVNVAHYPPDQLDAWAPANPNKDVWLERFSTSHTPVVVEHSRIIGFGNFILSGIVETFYVSKDHQRRGVRRLLLHDMFDCASRLKLPQVLTEASITARPFFEAHGFLVLEEQRKAKNGSVFINYIMKKRLTR